MNWPYTQVELVDLGKQFQQMQGKTLAAWLCNSAAQGWAWHLLRLLWVFTEKSRRMACKTILKVWRPQRGPEQAKAPSGLWGCKCGLICVEIYSKGCILCKTLYCKCCVLWCRFRTMYCSTNSTTNVLLTSDSLAVLEQYESIWYLVDRLWMPQKSPPWRCWPSAYGGFAGP